MLSRAMFSTCRSPWSHRHADGVDAATDVLDEDEVAGRRTGAVNGQFLVQERAGDKAWNDLFEVLARAERVERPDDRDRDAVRRPLGVDQPVRAAFGAGIGAHRLERVLLVHQLPLGRTVDFASSRCG